MALTQIVSPDGAARRGGRGSPWRRADILTLPLPYAIAVVCLGLAWADAHRGLTVAHQTDSLNVGVAGVIVVGVANAIWLLSGRRRVAFRRRRLARLLADRCGEPSASPTVPEPRSGDLLVGVAGGRLSHRPGCPLLAGRATVPAGSEGQRPCGVCRP